MARMRNLCRALLGAAWLVSWTGVAHADDDARAAYDRGTVAFGQRSYQTAAEEFARADELAPNPIALESAIKAAILADDAVLAMTLADRAALRPRDPRVDEQVTRARQAYAQSVGRVTLRCPERVACSLEIAGEAVAPDEPRYLGAGEHHVKVSVDGRASDETLRVAGGATLDWRAPAPVAPAGTTPAAPSGPAAAPAPVRPAEPTGDVSSGGISPAWFFVGAGLTVVAGVTAIGLGASAVSLNDEFQAGDDAAADTGKTMQTGANVAWAVTGALAVATVVVGVVAVDWSGDDRPDAALVLRPGGVSLASQF